MIEIALAQGEGVPHVTLMLVVGGHDDTAEESRKLFTMLAFLVGEAAGAGGKVMPGGVFLIVIDMLMPSWDPLRGDAGIELMHRDVAAVVESVPDDQDSTQEEVRQWVESNPGRVNERGEEGNTPLILAVEQFKDLPIVVWLLDEKGADVNVTTLWGSSSLHKANRLDILNVLMDRGAIPVVRDEYGLTILMEQTRLGLVENVGRLLQDPHVRATIDVPNQSGGTALFNASLHRFAPPFLAQLLLQAGANPLVADSEGATPLAIVQQRYPSRHTTITLLQQAISEAEKTALLIKARRVVTLATSTHAIHSYLQDRVAQYLPLPRLMLTSTMDGHDDSVGEGRSFHIMIAFLLGMGGGPEGKDMPRGAFGVVLDLLMPRWDPLRRGLGQEEEQLEFE